VTRGSSCKFASWRPALVSPGVVGLYVNARVLDIGPTGSAFISGWVEQISENAALATACRIIYSWGIVVGCGAVLEPVGKGVSLAAWGEQYQGPFFNILVLAIAGWRLVVEFYRFGGRRPTPHSCALRLRALVAARHGRQSLICQAARPILRGRGYSSIFASRLEFHATIVDGFAPWANTRSAKPGAMRG